MVKAAAFLLGLASGAAFPPVAAQAREVVPFGEGGRARHHPDPDG